MESDNSCRTASIAGFRDQIKEQARPVYNKLLEALKKGNFLHIDETGWKVDGAKHWLWKLSNKKISLTHIDKGRGRKVLEDLSGEDFEGAVISDFLSAIIRT